MKKTSEQKPYDESLVNGFVGVGLHHLARRYGEGQVIKFPIGLPYKFNPKQWCANLERDGAVLKEYFADYLSDAQIYFYNQKEKLRYVIIEPYYRGLHLRRHDLKDSSLREQFIDIVERNEKMQQRVHLSLDFFGVGGLLWKGRHEVCNIMLEESTNRLQIIDRAALHFGKTRDQQTVISLVTALGLQIQKRLLKRLLRSDKL